MTESARIAKVGERLIAVVLIALLVQLTLLVYVFEQSYRGRQQLVMNQRDACARGKLDREVNALGWRAAQAARERSAESAATGAQRASDLRAAAAYDGIATSLESRSGNNLSCAEAFPKASPWPWDNDN